MKIFFRQLDQLEHRVSSDISTILSILTENRQQSLSFTPNNNSNGSRIRRTASSDSPPMVANSAQSYPAREGQPTHHMAQRSTSQPTDISQVKKI